MAKRAGGAGPSQTQPPPAPVKAPAARPTKAGLPHRAIGQEDTGRRPIGANLKSRLKTQRALLRLSLSWPLAEVAGDDGNDVSPSEDRQKPANGGQACITQCLRDAPEQGGAPLRC